MQGSMINLALYTFVENFAGFRGRLSPKIVYRDKWCSHLVGIFLETFLLAPMPILVTLKRLVGPKFVFHPYVIIPDSKVHGAIMRPIWGLQDPGGPHVCPIDFAIWDGRVLSIFSHMHVTKSGTVEILDWINNFYSLFIGHVITYPCIF